MGIPTDRSKNYLSGYINLIRVDNSFLMGYGAVSNSAACSLADEFLHEEEARQLRNYNHGARQKSFLLGRIAAKCAMKAITYQRPNSISIDSGIFNFPVVRYLRSEHLQISITHCDEIGLALAFPEKHPVGIDIELIDIAKTESIYTQLTDHEKGLLSKLKLSETVGCVLLWTVKESLSKIFKTGMMMDFKIYEVAELRSSKMLWHSTFTHCLQYKGISAVLYPYIVSMVLPRKTEIDEDHIAATLFSELSGLIQALQP